MDHISQIFCIGQLGEETYDYVKDGCPRPIDFIIHILAKDL